MQVWCMRRGISITVLAVDAIDPRPSSKAPTLRKSTLGDRRSSCCPSLPSARMRSCAGLASLRLALAGAFHRGRAWRAFYETRHAPPVSRTEAIAEFEGSRPLPLNNYDMDMRQCRIPSDPPSNFRPVAGRLTVRPRADSNNRRSAKLVRVGQPVACCGEIGRKGRGHHVAESGMRPKPQFSESRPRLTGRYYFTSGTV